jgi:hypothetical protein
MATDRNDARAVYSNYGPSKDIAAPGGDGSSEEGWILSTAPGGYYAWMKGTSAAAPVVSGVVALMLSADPSLTVSDVKSRLYGSAVDLGMVGKDDYFGHGRVNAAYAIRSVRGLHASAFSIDRRTGCVVGVPVGTLLPAVRAALSSSFGTVSFYDAQGNAAPEGVAKTGMYAQLKDGAIVKDELAIAVMGDVNGDGDLSISDYTQLRLHLLQIISLPVAACAAGEVSGDGALNITDYTYIRLALQELRPLG